MSASQSLEQLARQGRAQRDARAQTAARQATAAHREEAAAERETQARTMAIRHYSSRRSLTGWQALNWMNLEGRMPARALLLGAGALVGAMAIAGVWLAILIPVAVIVGVLGISAWRVEAAIERDKALRAALPFQVVGYEPALAMGRSYPSDRLTLHFQGAAPPPQLIEDLLALLPHPTKITKTTPSSIALEVNSTVGSKFDGYRRWFVRWFYALCLDALVPLERAYPIDRVVFRD